MRWHCHHALPSNSVKIDRHLFFYIAIFYMPTVLLVWKNDAESGKNQALFYKEYKRDKFFINPFLLYIALGTEHALQTYCVRPVAFCVGRCVWWISLLPNRVQVVSRLPKLPLSLLQEERDCWACHVGSHPSRTFRDTRYRPRIGHLPSHSPSEAPSKDTLRALSKT